MLSPLLSWDVKITFLKCISDQHETLLGHIAPERTLHLKIRLIILLERFAPELSTATDGEITFRYIFVFGSS